MRFDLDSVFFMLRRAGPFLIQIWFSLWRSREDVVRGGAGVRKARRGLTAFGSSLRKLFRIHFLSPLVAPPLLSADYLELFPNFFPVFFYGLAFILPKCFDKFFPKSQPSFLWLLLSMFCFGSCDIYGASFVIWFMACLSQRRDQANSLMCLDRLVRVRRSFYLRKSVCEVL